MESDPSREENDPVLQLHEARTVIIEKDREIEAKNRQIQEKNDEIAKMKSEIWKSKTGMRREIEMFQEKYYKELRREEKKLEPDIIFEMNNLITKQLRIMAEDREEIGPATSHSSALAQFEDLKMQLEDVESRIEELTQQRKNLLVQIATKRASTFEEQNTSVLILGGWFNCNTIYLLDSKAQSWKKLKITLPMGMRSFGAVVLYEEIYIFGGRSSDAYQQDCYKLKDDGNWMQLASLNQNRANISSSSLVYKGDIWVIGGYPGDSRERLKSVEKYDISQDKWTYMPEMNYAKYGAAAAVFKDRIFVTGGWNEEGLKSAEMFDPKLQKWILFCDLPFVLIGHTMLINNSTLSIFGGFSGSGLNGINSVWEMDIEDPEKKWTEKQSFKHPREYFGIGKLSNGIIGN